MDKYVIICVDDEQTILNSLKIELKKALAEKYLIETAEDGKAIRLINELLSDGYQIPLIISDVYLSVAIDCYDKCILSSRTLKYACESSVLDAVGAYAINHAGLYRYISKPWQSEDLRLTVVEAVRSYFQGKISRTKKLHYLAERQAKLIENCMKMKAV
ncbi:MAG: hypothetical protein R3E08_13150 [Thiotrichaceae bacterium]